MAEPVDPRPSDALRIAAHADEVRRASEWLDAACERHGVPEHQADRLQLTLNEALANVIVHGGASARAAPIDLGLTLEADRDTAWALVTVHDAGVPFDPTSAPARAAPRSLAEAVPGGRGITIMRRCTDRLDYRHDAGLNRLTFGVRWVASPAPTAHFKRGPDRRVHPEAHDPDRRHGPRRREALGWIALFRDADPRELDEALAACDVLALPAGTTLLRPGEPNRNVYVLLSGRLEARIGDAEKPEMGIAIAAGECIGEISAIDGKPPSALVHALSDVRVLRLDGDLFWERLMQLRGVAANLMTTLADRMRRSNRAALAMQRERLELQHLRKELDLARQFQVSMLPLERPLFPGRDDLEACGFMEPASKVGGDLFDLFFVDGDTLFVCIGDVSGHGIAAALFMVRVIGLLRVIAQETTRPEKVLEALNDRLCAGRETGLFVTLFCGFLDVPSGRFTYSNAGHCPPMVRSPGGARWLPIPKGMVVGAVPARRYASLEGELTLGETLFCYSDGLTESRDPAGREVGAEAFRAWLQCDPAVALHDLLDGLFERVVAHMGTRAIVDDCTMVAVRRIAPN